MKLRRKDIVAWWNCNKGFSQREMGQVLGVHPSTIGYRVGKVRDSGLIHTIRIPDFSNYLSFEELRDTLSMVQKF